MQFEIEHRLQYRYSRPVFIEPMTLRLRPLCDVRQTLLEFSCRIEDHPVGTSSFVDLDGNVVTQAWFCDLHPVLSIQTRSIVKTHVDNPFNFLLGDSGVRTLPVAYSPELTAVLGAYRGGARDRAVGTLADEIQAKVESRTLDFLFELSVAINQRIEYIERAEGPPWEAGYTLSEGRGSCRDSAVLFIEACRHVGLAARFVSGYKQELEDGHIGALHAWAEVYLPGAGWRGYDPSLGIAVADRHIVLASGADPLFAAPTTGRFRGTGVTSELISEVTVRQMSAD